MHQGLRPLDTNGQAPDAGYTYNPILRGLKRERYLVLTVAAGVAAVVAYRALFPSTGVDEDRLPKYLRVIGDFESLITNLEQSRDRELEIKLKGGAGAVDASGPKMGLYQIYDYMFVWEMRPDSPFFKGFSPAEKDLVASLQRLGRMVDGALIALADSTGNPETPMDFPKMREELKRARAIYERERARR